ncbi:MAG: ATP-dependent DNA helicase RecG [Lachnospiraceae bacterium]|jgi:ATP-dependent DNA helicase RecG|nr:ATP-dependent DNA helicase RecG [Lachnospiraceae bacterium]
MEHTSGIGELKGIGAKTEQLFHNLGVYTVGDMLLHYPRDYERLPPVAHIADLPGILGEEAGQSEGVAAGGGTRRAGQAEGVAAGGGARRAGQAVAIALRVSQAPFVRAGRNMQVTSLTVQEQGVKAEFVWFRMPYLKNTLKIGQWFVLVGKAARKGQAFHMEQPQVFAPEKYQSMQQSLWPCYPLTAGLGKNKVSQTVKKVLEELDLSVDYLPEEVRGRCQLAEYNFAIENIHFPGSEEALEQARRRLVFDEFFQFILSAGLQKEQMEEVVNDFAFLPLEGSSSLWADQVAAKLPYQLTKAQERTLLEIRRDLRGKKVMQRLVQGDVGSGKTILAFLSMLDAAQAGYQSALMAPTEVLAVQHYQTFTSLCQSNGLRVPVILLTGSLTKKEKRQAYERMQIYPNAMVIGTHALIQEQALFDNLALVVTDEQHRFGVKQRESLFQKGAQPHVLVMSATPIPRTLAIILYGDLDISVVDEVPAKRLPVKSCVVGKKARPASYRFLEKELAKGHQAYVICPLVEESEGLDMENVTDYAQMLQGQMPQGIVVECLHGKMKSGRKNLIMEQFARNEIQVLVSTTVIEVGVNVPNATVMMVEDAQRFGLAQLHQLRGRVGRGSSQSYCIMVHTTDSKKAQKRLEILNQSNDGFYIASEDLKLRGPGDFFGIRQSGLLEFRLGDIYQNADVLKLASEEANRILAEDRQLMAPEHREIRGRIQSYLDRQGEIVNL